MHNPNWPQERARLLGLTQRALNEGNTNAVVFVTGDQVGEYKYNCFEGSQQKDEIADVILPFSFVQHWAELMAKQMPESEAYGPSQVMMVLMCHVVISHAT